MSERVVCLSSGRQVIVRKRGDWWLVEDATTRECMTGGFKSAAAAERAARDMTEVALTQGELRGLGTRLAGIMDGAVDDAAEWLAPVIEAIVAARMADACQRGRAGLAAKVEALADEHARHIARYATQYDGRGGVSHYDHGGLWCGCGEWDSGPMTGPRPWADWHAHVVRAILAATEARS